MKRLIQLLPRQRGQVALMMAVALPMIMGLAGISIDLGYGYAHRREAQNAADAAALAGAIALGRSYSHQSAGSGGCGDAGTSDCTNNLVTREATVAALSALPDFPTPPSGTGTPSLPSGTTVEVRYISGYGDSGTTVPSNGNIAWTGTNPPPLGVRALVGYTYPTFFMRVAGISTVHVGTTARVVFAKPASPSPGNGPFIVCGGGTGGGSGANRNGAFEWDYPGQEPTSNKNVQTLLLGSPPNMTVDYATYANKFFVVHWGQLGQAAQNGISGDQGHADCGVDSKKASSPQCQPGGGLYGSPSCTTNQFKGVAIVQGSTTIPGCTPVTAGTPIPCNEQGDGGTKAGPSTAAITASGFPGCTDANDDNWTGCVVTLPIANDCDGNIVCTNQTTAAFLICPGAQLIASSPCNTSFPSNPFPTSAPTGCTSNCHVGMLLPAAMTTLPPSPGTVVSFPTGGCTNTQTTPCAIGQFVLTLAPDS